MHDTTASINMSNSSINNCNGKSGRGADAGTSDDVINYGGNSNESLAQDGHGSSNRTTSGGWRDNGTLMEEANKAYWSVVDTFKDGILNASNLLDESDETGRRYRGLLLGWSCEDGASVNELLTGRLQHDIGYSEVNFQLDKFSVKKTSLPKLSNKEIIEELCKTVALLLKKYSCVEQLKFTKGGQLINRGVVAVLFDVGKRDNIRMNELVMKYETRTLMIDQCLKWCPINKKVNAKIAKAVFQKFVGDPTGSDSTELDLNEVTKDFGEHVKKIMSGGYLDVTMGITNQEELVEETLNNKYKMPTVAVEEVITSIDCRDDKFSVVVIHNFVSEVFKRKWVKRMDELLFATGKGSKSNAFVRNCSTTNEPAPMLIGDKHVYGGLIPDAIENDLINMAVYFAEEQQKMIEAAYGLYKVTWHCNLVHTVVAAIRDAIYGAHSDANPTCCSGSRPMDPYIHVDGCHYLPKQKEMQVATMVFSNCQDDFSTELVYTHQGKRILKHIKLSSCCLHWQGPGSQALGVKHQVKVLNTVSTGGIFRAHSTFRFSLDPKVHADVFRKTLSDGLHILEPSDSSSWKHSYTEKGVIDLCTHCYPVLPEDPDAKDTKAIYCPNANETTTLLLEKLLIPTSNLKESDGCIGIYSTLTVNLYSKLLTDTYDQIPRKQYIELVPEERRAKIRLAGTMAQELSSAYAVKELFNAGYLLEVQTLLNKNAIPCLHQVNVKRDGDIGSNTDMSLPVPGKRYPLSCVCAQAGYTHSSRSHRIYNPNLSNQRVLILSQPYKNDKDSINTYLQRLDERDTVNGSKPFFDNNFDGTIWIHGSGGSPSFPGDVPPDADVSSKDDPMILIPMSQDISNPLNVALMKMVMLREVVTIYVNEAMFEGATEHKHREADVPTTQEVCRCLGVFFAHEFVGGRDSTEVVEQRHCSDPLHKQKFARYMLSPYLKFAFKPLLSNADLESIWDAERNETVLLGERKRKMTLQIPFNCSDQLETDIPIGGVDDAASLMPGKRILRSTIIKRFIHSDQVKKYTMPSVPSSDVPYTCDNSANEDHVDNEGDDNVLLDTTETYDGAVVKKMTASIQGLVRAMTMCSVAGAYRYAGSCFESVDGKKIARPLLVDCGLPDLFRIHPMPMPNRALDVVSVGLRADLVSDGTFLRCRTDPNCRIKLATNNTRELVGALFKSVLLRFTGRLNSFWQYSQVAKKDSMLPGITEIEGFLAFMRSTLGGKGTVKRIPRWISEQHSHSIPKETKIYTGFEYFITGVAEGLGEVTDKMLEVTVGEFTRRKNALILLTDLLLECSQADDNNKLDFMAHQVLSDVEEIFDEPFGKVTAHSVHAGSGAEQGYKMMRNVKETEAPSNLKHALQLIVDYMEKIASKRDLDLTGYYRTAGGGNVVRNKMNGRPFNATDAEHFLCKLWVIAKYTLPAYRISRQPMATKPHCHPVNLRGREYEADPLLNTIMSDIIKEGCPYSMNETKPPEFCLLPGEQGKDTTDTE